MKLYLLGIISTALILLTSCASHPDYYNAQVRNDLVQENWMQRINTDPDKWTTHASHWFFTDEPTKFDDYAAKAPASQAVTAMMVRVPDFTDVKIDGPYQVQLSGEQDHNSVFVLGSNDAAGHTRVEIHKNVLYVHPANDCKACASIKDVIVRIGVRDLRNLVVNGTGSIEGKHILSSGLSVHAKSCADILLAGSMNLLSVIQQGTSTSTISIIGATTPTLSIQVPSDGNVNVSGHVGINTIKKQGKGTINIIGADSDSLKIDSSGAGTTNIAGFVNLKNINVMGKSQVYIYWVNSNGIYINLHDNAQLGIAGSVKNLDINADGMSRFWGKFLRADNIYIKTRGAVHANVNPSQKLFASAFENSSIYFFTSPNVLSRFALDNAIVLPVWCDACGIPMPQSTMPTTVTSNHMSYKGEFSYKGEAPYHRQKNYKREFSYSSTHHHRQVRRDVKAEAGRL